MIGRTQAGQWQGSLLANQWMETWRQLTQAARHMAVITLGKVRRGEQTIRARINIENTRQLKQAGFSVGTRFRVSVTDGMVEVVRDPASGTNTIAPKRFARRDGSETLGERLDLRSDDIFDAFAGQERVLALYLDGRLVFLHLPTTAANVARRSQLVDSVERGRLRTAALYAGIGTLDAALHEGLAQSGLSTAMAFANDSWDLAIGAMLESNPACTAQTRTFAGGIEQFLASGATLQDIDMVVLGIPCKGASRLNVATRDLPEMHNIAGHQVLNAVMALQRLNFPPLVLVENVTAYADTVSLSMLRRVLEEQGYQTELVGDRDDQGRYRGINSNDYGDIERRVRMALLAYPQGITLTFAGMRKTGPSTRTVGDIRLPEHQVAPAEYAKGLNLSSAAKQAKGWKNRVIDDSATTTPSLSADCWKQRVEDPKFRHPHAPEKCRLPLPEEHAALKGHDPRLINALPANSAAHTALGNGTAKRCWVEFGRVLGKELRRVCAALARSGSCGASPWHEAVQRGGDLFAEDSFVVPSLP